MTVREMVKKYLEENGYDGLCCDECRCGKDDLFHCGCEWDNCESAYSHVLTSEDIENGEYMVDEEPGDIIYTAEMVNK